MLTVDERDTWSTWTWLATVAFAAGILLAITGVPGVDVHGPLHYMGIMDPLCGGTRAWYLTMHGQLREAIRYNPAVPVLLIATIAVVIRAIAGRTTGHWITPHVSRRILLPALAITILALAINQQLNAPLLLEAWQG